MFDLFGSGNSSSQWWERYRQRYRQEVSDMERYTNATLKAVDGQLVWNERIYSGLHKPYDIAIVAQNNHPYDPPQAFILYPSIVPSLTYHMWPGGDLCLARDCDMSSRTTVLIIRNWTCMWASLYDIYLRTGDWIGLEH